MKVQLAISGVLLVLPVEIGISALGEDSGYIISDHKGGVAIDETAGCFIDDEPIPGPRGKCYAQDTLSLPDDFDYF